LPLGAITESVSSRSCITDHSHRASWERVARKLHGRRLHSSLLEALRRSSSTQQFASRGPALVIE
jgi:hypothetical protein